MGSLTNISGHGPGQFSDAPGDLLGLTREVRVKNRTLAQIAKMRHPRVMGFPNSEKL
jgi:hypothetical protein